MSGKIERASSVTGTYTLTSSASTSPKIPFGASAGAVFVVDSVAGSATKINWHVCLGPELTPAPIYADGAALTTDIVASRAYAIPDALFAAPFIVGATDAGTAVIRLSVKG